MINMLINNVNNYLETHPDEEDVNFLLSQPLANAHPGAMGEGKGGERMDDPMGTISFPPFGEELVRSSEVFLIP